MRGQLGEERSVRRSRDDCTDPPHAV
jgi:hypothetical protein